jgi:hypothetical protein
VSLKNGGERPLENVATSHSKHRVWPKIVTISPIETPWIQRSINGEI